MSRFRWSAAGHPDRVGTRSLDHRRTSAGRPVADRLARPRNDADGEKPVWRPRGFRAASV